MHSTNVDEEKQLGGLPSVALPPTPVRETGRRSWKATLGWALLGAFAWYRFDVYPRLTEEQRRIVQHGPKQPHTWGPFPHPDDAFHFVPCTNATLPPRIDEACPLQAWSHLYDPNPQHWSWTSTGGLYLCGWLDVPLDYTNSSDDRIARLAVTKLQHSPRAKSRRTMVVEPGGPGGSGTSLVWRKAETFAQEYSDNTMDVLGWDPRGVNVSQPSISCFPYDADRDRWSLLTSRFHRQVRPQPLNAMLTADAMNEATLRACHAKYGDVGGMLTTAFVARDLEEIRKALREDEVNGYFISYGTGIAQTYANMFPQSVGRMMLDGTEYVRDHRQLGGFGWTALDNITAAFHDGLIGECIAAGPDHCALTQPLQKDGNAPPTREELIETMDTLLEQLVHRPIPGFTEKSGPVLITYSSVVSLIYSSLYNPFSWDSLAVALADVLRGNATLLSRMVDSWEYDPSDPLPTPHSSDELMMLVVCSDQYDSPLPATYDAQTNGEQYYLDLWSDMTSRSEIGGDGRFFDILACRHWNATFGAPKEVYRGDLNHTLSHPVLLIAETYDPATPLRNGRRLLNEMGRHNARLVAHHGYGHSSRDTSRCTNDIMRSYMLNGTLPHQAETACYADHKPYRYDAPKSSEALVEAWQAHVAEMRLLAPRHAPKQG